MSLAYQNPQTSAWLKSLRIGQSALRTHERHLNRLLTYIAVNDGPPAVEVRFQQIVPKRLKGLLIGHGPANHRFVEGFLAWLVREQADRDKAAAARNRTLSTLRLFFRFLVEQQVLVEDPTYHVDPAREKRRIRADKYLRPNESAALLKAAASSGEHAARNVALVATLLRSGLRPGELCNLTVQGVEFHTERLRTTGKTGERCAPMPPALADLLRAYLSSRYYRAHCAGAAVLFPGDDGQSPLTAARLLQILRPLFAVAEISDEVTTYWLRHTFATDLNRLGVAFPLIGKGLGHARLKNTLHYAHEREPRLRRIVEEGPAGQPLVRLYRKMFRTVPGGHHPGD